MSIATSEIIALEAGSYPDAAASDVNTLDHVVRRFCGAIESATSNLDLESFRAVTAAIITLIHDLNSARASGQTMEALGFTICGRFFPVRISSERLYDAEGAEAWAITDPSAGEILIWRECPKAEWLHTLRHEFHRVWAIYHYEPESQTAAAMNFANESSEFERQFAAQGGIAALLSLKPTVLKETK